MCTWHVHKTETFRYHISDVILKRGKELVKTVLVTLPGKVLLQYNFIAKCQYTDCTRNVLWCQVHSSHIHFNHNLFFKIKSSKIVIKPTARSVTKLLM